MDTQESDVGPLTLKLRLSPESPTSRVEKKVNRIARNYTSDERRRLLAEAMDCVINDGASLRLAADKFGLAKSSLSDYLKKQGVDVRNRGKRPLVVEDADSKEYSPPVQRAKFSHLPTQVPMSSYSWHSASNNNNNNSSSDLEMDSSDVLGNVSLLGDGLCSNLLSSASNNFAASRQRSLNRSASSMMNAQVLARAEGFVDFVNKSPTAFHVVKESKSHLKTAGFQELRDKDPWKLEPMGRYFVTRNGSLLIAFAVGGRWKPGNGFSIVGAHTDSPCLKLKPVSARRNCGYVQLGVQCYGGGLWYSWLDRDLTVAGRVVVRREEGLQERLVHVQRPLLRLPSLAIHLNRTANESFTLNKETEMSPILCTALEEKIAGKEDGDKEGSHPSELLEVLGEELNVSPDSIVDLELCVVDTQPAQLGGLKREFIFSPRLDNQVSCYAGLYALLEAPGIEEDPLCRVVCMYDNEEVGSQSNQGAGSLFTEQVLRRISQGSSACLFEQAIAGSVLLSADQAHAVHPNYEDKHEKKHKVAIHGGMVLKHNANQRYATTARTASLLRECAHRAGGLPLQEFVVRQDTACGSTIGPILSARLGVATLDVGSPQLSMHSAREMGSAPGIQQSVEMFQAFFEHLPSVLSSYSTED